MIKISEPLISVIVPIYNVASYLPLMLDSLAHQNFKDIEILLINDGSTDCSLEICKDYCLRYSNMKLINQKNRGVSATRNLGIKRARGQWISFVDADDVIYPNYYEQFSQYINKSIDMIICKYTRDINDLTLGNGKSSLESAKKYFANMMDPKLPKYDGYLWNKLFRKEIILQNKIKFDNKLVVWEDMVFVEQYLKYCRYVLFVDDILYFYRKRAISITNDPNREMDLLRSKNKACNILKALTDYHHSIFWQILHIQLENKLSLYKQIVVSILKK